MFLIEFDVRIGYFLKNEKTFENGERCKNFMSFFVILEFFRFGQEGGYGSFRNRGGIRIRRQNQRVISF